MTKRNFTCSTPCLVHCGRAIILLRTVTLAALSCSSGITLSDDFASGQGWVSDATAPYFNDSDVSSNTFFISDALELQDEISPEELPEGNDGPGSDRSVDEPLGQAPPDTSRFFLRESSVLLQPGQWQVEYGFEYALQEDRQFFQLISGDILPERFRDRRFVIPFSVRYGLSPRMQLSASLPVGGAFVERADAFEDENSSVFGIGDVFAGLNYVLRDGQDMGPDAILSVRMNAPTGKDPFTDVTPSAGLGNGFWSVGTDLTFTRSYDPGVLFLSVGYFHDFGRTYKGSHVQPGEGFSYSFGMSFAINDTLTASSEVIGSYQGATEFDGFRVPDSSSESISMRMSVVRVISKYCFVEPSVLFGLSEDAPSAILSATITRQY